MHIPCMQADLNGDGSVEIIVATHASSIQVVISIQVDA